MQRGAIHFFGFFLNFAIFRFDLPLFIQEAYINYVHSKVEVDLDPTTMNILDGFKQPWSRAQGNFLHKAKLCSR